jgi:hypothetical protein
MIPTPDQIRVDAYHRWRRSGGRHGRDRDDWLDAEQALLYSLNYSVVARIVTEPFAGDDVGGRVGDNGPSRDGMRESAGVVCRFCEQAAPRVLFSRRDRCDGRANFQGDGTLIVPDECDECRLQFEESIAEDVALLVGSLQGGGAPDPAVSSFPASAAYIPVAAFKGLTRMALACLPRRELAAFENAIEWVGNLDHDLDLEALGPLMCDVQFFAEAFPAPWARLSLKGEDVPMPRALFHLGRGRSLVQIAVPLGNDDDELDGEHRKVPLAAPSALDGLDVVPTSMARVSLASANATRETRVRWI